jgi:hypothetical protein
MFLIENTIDMFSTKNNLCSRVNMSDSLLARRRISTPGVADLDHVVALAAETIDELDLNPPINLEIVASYFGVSRVILDDIPWAGCLIVNDDVVEIRLRQSDGPARRRFSGFHEVTHTFMPGYRLVTQYRCDPQPSRSTRDEVEVLCDAGASELLLPKRWFVRDLVAGDFGIELLEELADSYDASMEATAHRIVDYWPEEVAFFSLELRNKPRDLPGAAPALRVNMMRGRGLFPWVPAHKSVNLGSLATLVDGEIISERLPNVELLGQDLGPCHLVAKHYPFVDQEGETRHRVLALVRRTEIER